MPVERFDFPGSDGQSLAARLEIPVGPVRAYALFAHCFTCGKDNSAATRIGRALSERGIAVLRFDFTGLGSSEGDFANSSFSSNVEDLVAAADHLRRTRRAPSILIGHSLGGAAVLAAAEKMPEARAVVAIAAPFEPAHLRKLLDPHIPAIEREGVADVTLAGRPFTIRRQLLDDLDAQDQEARIRGLRRALLVMHAPRDEQVGIENASAIFTRALHPKSFISLDDADHLLSRREDAEYAAHVLAAWASRYLDAPEAPDQPAEGRVLVTETGQGRFQQSILAGYHRLLADEPAASGGQDTGPSPYDLLLAALGSCTAMTLRLYAERKGWPLGRVEVTLRHEKIHAADCADCETREGRIDRIDREIALGGPLDPTQRARLLEIADRCPVHRTLRGEVSIRSRARD